MGTPVYNFTVEQGETLTKVIVRRNKITLVPENMTGWIISLRIQPTRGNQPLIFTEATGHIVLDVEAGKITIVLPSSTTQTFTWRTGTYLLQAILLNGSVKFLLKGEIKVNPRMA